MRRREREGELRRREREGELGRREREGELGDGKERDVVVQVEVPNGSK